MWHKTRRWSSVAVEPEELVEKLMHHTWTLCTGFECPAASAIFWLNDSTSPDAVQEYAVVRRLPNGSFDQIESITVSWCDAAGLARYIAECAQPEHHAFFGRLQEPVRIDPIGAHGSCPHCR